MFLGHRKSVVLRIVSEFNVFVAKASDFVWIQFVLAAEFRNLTPADVFYGRDQDILEQRQQIKHNTMSMRRKMVYDNRNNLTNLMS